MTIAGTFDTGHYSSTIAVNNNGTVQNVVNNASFSNTDSISQAGIVYNNQSSGVVRNCVNNADFVTLGRSAGIVSNNIGSAQIIDSKNYGNVTAHYASVSNNAYAAGIVAVVGEPSATKTPKIINCSNFGNITSDTATEKFSTGGIAGWSYGNAQILSCSNFGEVTGSGYGTGGIVGICKENNLLVDRCYTVGNVNSTRNNNPYIGGVIGHCCDVSTGNATISNCFVASPISISKSSASYVGKIVGSNAVRVTSSNNYVAFTSYGGSGSIKSGSEVVISDGVTDLGGFLTQNEKDLVKYVRLFSCQAEYEHKSALIATLESLTTEEVSLLDSVNHYDVSGENTQSYLNAANYIVGYNGSSLQVLSGQMNIFNENASVTYVFVITAVATLCILLILKKNITLPLINI